jgi:hypothetical protein
LGQAAGAGHPAHEIIALVGSAIRWRTLHADLLGMLIFHAELRQALRERPTQQQDQPAGEKDQHANDRPPQERRRA